MFWDKWNDELEILGEDGNFYLYGEDTVARDQGSEQWQYWLKIHKAAEVSPLNSWERYEYMHPKTGEWLQWADVDKTFLTKIHRHARDPQWREAKYRP